MTNLKEATEDLKLVGDDLIKSDESFGRATHSGSSQASGFVPPKSNQCALCGHPSKTHCKACADGHGNLKHKPTYYCGTECQTKHWKSHKAVCKTIQDLKYDRYSPELKQLHHAAELLLGVFYIEQEMAFLHNRIDKVVDEDGKITVYEKVTVEDTDTKMSRLPKDFFKTRRIRNAVLSYMGCSAAVAWQFGVLRDVVSGLAKRIEEIKFFPKNKKLEVVHKLANGQKHQCSQVHTVLRITLPDGSKHAWDLSAAQFGWTEILTPWSEYEQQKLLFMVGAYEHGTTRQEFLSDTSKGDAFTSNMKSFELVAQHLQWCVVNFVESFYKGNMTNLLNQDHRNFEIGKALILAYIGDNRDAMYKRQLETRS